MKEATEYLEFIETHGKPLSELNPGSQEWAMTPEDSLKAFELLKNNGIAILGADIMSEDENGKLSYITHLWGNDYHYLNWHCDQLKDENYQNYIKRSHKVAEEGIIKAHNTAEELNKKCYIVFVI